MGLSRFGFWFFLVFMIPLSVFLACMNYKIEHYGMLSLNLFTIAMSIFNVYTFHRSIKRWKEFKISFLAGEINRTINGGK